MALEETEKLGLQENFEWNVENEIKLFEAMIGHKPVGINKHFHMACITEKFESLLGKPVSPDVLWKHLERMYDLAALDKKESLPFPNEPEEFTLPESEYLDLMNEKLTLKVDCVSDLKDNNKDGRAVLKNVKDSTPAKEAVAKKEKKSDTEETVGNNYTEKKEMSDLENDGRKRKSSKEIKTRGKRSLKDKKSDELSTTPVSGNKKEENSVSSHSVSKKEKQTVGKRSLRSRADDSLPTKSLTPPPVKRARRI